MTNTGNGSKVVADFTPGDMLWIVASPTGRINRTTFWAATVPYFIAHHAVVGVLGIILIRTEALALAVPGTILLFTLPVSWVWMGFATIAKRMHGRDRSAAVVFACLIPFVGGIVFLWMFFVESALGSYLGENRYGPAPAPGINRRPR